MLHKHPRLVLGIAIGSLFLNVILLLVTWPYVKTAVLHIKPAGQGKAIDPLKVRVALAQKTSMARKIPVSGTVKALDVVPIMSEIPGKVAKVNFRQGDIVKKGDVLIQLDDRQALADLKDALARAKQSEAQYRRQQLLMQKKYGSPAALEKAEADWAAALAAVEKAQVQVQFTQIRAPFEGEIGLHNLSVGMHVAPNQEITRLVSADPLEVEFQIPESDIGKIFVEQEIEVLAEGYDTLPSTARITAIEPYSDPIAHTVKVRAQMDNPEHKIKDGAFARVIVPLSQEQESIAVPQEAVVQEGEQDFIFRVVKGRAFKVPVLVGARERGNVQVEGEVKEGDSVVTDPVEMLMDGLPVLIEEEDASSSSAEPSEVAPAP